MDQKHKAVRHVEAWVYERLGQSATASHDWLHTDRVRRTIRILARAEGVDPILAELAALLHDVGRSQPGPENEHGARSAAMAGPILANLRLTGEEQEAVLYAIQWHNSLRADTALLRVLRDADMLDGLGAMGLMRAFMSQAHLPAYEPAAPFEKVGESLPGWTCSDQVLFQMEWYAKLNTVTARQMARSRFAFMEAFVQQAQQEIRTKDDADRRSCRPEVGD